MCNNSESEQLENKCMVCSHMNRVSPHFGSHSCLACASFFRRTVSLNIRYVCKADRRCPIFHKIRIICRSCRYDKCIESGMKREAVQPRRSFSKIPKYVEELRKDTNNDAILRDYATSPVFNPSFLIDIEKASSTCDSRSSATSPSLTETSESDAGGSKYSNILDISSDELLQFYCEQTKFSLTQRNEPNYDMGDVAYQMCKICPGADLLGANEMEVLYRYSFFSCEIMDSVWAECQYPDSFLNARNRYNSPEASFMEEIQRNIYDALKLLNLNGVEYSALKALCMWKLGICDFTMSMKVVAQEQYCLINSGLSVYYKDNLKKDEMYAVTRVADITLVLGKIFESYMAMIVAFQRLQIPLVFNLEDE